MKILLQVTIEVDPDDWANLAPCARGEVRQNVKDYVGYGIAEMAGIAEVDAQISWK